MNRLKAILADNRSFLIVYLLFFVTGLVFVLKEGKAAVFIALNPYHSGPLDVFFTWYTYIGDGLFTIVIFVIFLLKKYWSKASQVMAAFLLSALIAQILKNIFSMPRPKEFFPPGQYTHFIEGVTGHGFASFPSGHTTSIFALVMLLACFEKDVFRKLFYLFLGLSVGYSRVYLGQHFLGDVLVGSCIGVMTSIFVHWLFTEKLKHVKVFAKG